MNPLKSLMGRRQFLAAAAVTSASGLFSNKISGIVDPAFHAGVAIASERAGTSGLKAGSGKYVHVLAPLKIRNKMLKNRMLVVRVIPAAVTIR